MSIKRLKFLVATLLFAFSARANDVQWKAPVFFNHHWQVGLGPGFLAGVNAPDLIISWRLGYGFHVTEDVEMAVMTDFGISSQRPDTHYFTVKVGADYNFSNEDRTPFATADLGYASVHAHADCSDASCQSPSDDASGVSLGVGGGYKFFRHSPVELGLLGRYDVMFATTRYGTPMKYSIQAIAYF